MIAVDTSSFVAYLSGDEGKDVSSLDVALEQKQVVFPPPVLTELLSDPSLSKPLQTLLQSIPLLEVLDGFWERAGHLRSRVLARAFKARLADALIAQLCIDHDVSLITRDRDFRHYVQLGELKLFSS